MEHPAVVLIEGLSPAISIDQKSPSHNPRSTVGTITEIYDYLRLLFARVGHPHCPVCGREISHQTPGQIVEEIQKLAKNTKPQTRTIVLAPVVKDRKGEYSQLFVDLAKKGFRQVRVDGQIKDIGDDFVLIKTNKHSIDAVVDKLTLPADKSRLTDSVEQGLNLADGNIIAAEIMDKSFDIPQYPKNLKEHLFSEKFTCPVDNISFSEIKPRTFSFNSPHGACPKCAGLGYLRKVDEELIANPNLSILEGAILPWAGTIESNTWSWRTLETVASGNTIDLNKNFAELPESHKKN